MEERQDLISRQAAIKALVEFTHLEWKYLKLLYPVLEVLEQLPSAQPEQILYANMSDVEFEKWLYEHGICHPNIHESIPCDVVPLLIDNAISELSSVHLVDKDTDVPVKDCISRQQAIDALAKNMPSLTTPDGCGEFDHDIQVTDEAYVDCMQIIHELPSAQPDIDEVFAHEKETEDRKKGKWIDETFKPWGLVHHPYKCNQCGGYSEADSDFCPDCGAKMEGTE